MFGRRGYNSQSSLQRNGGIAFLPQVDQFVRVHGWVPTVVAKKDLNT